VEGYELESDRYHLIFDGFDFSGVQWHDFWDYWTQQGGHRVFFAGPYVMQFSKSLPEVINEAMEDLNKFSSRLETEAVVLL
jgi:hypothetical protein